MVCCAVDQLQSNKLKKEVIVIFQKLGRELLSKEWFDILEIKKILFKWKLYSIFAKR